MTPGDNPLLTDLYQLTMLEGYVEHGMEEPAVFEFFVRRMPEARAYLLAAGLEQALDFLEGFRFGADEIAWLRRCGRFSGNFVDYLAGMRFSGAVHAMPEGTPFFADEPILRVTAPLPEAQLVESRLINIVHFQTLIATKAARMVMQAPDKLLVDFGLRRAHGAEAGLMAARASYLAGFGGTATVLAEKLFGIPAYGTMAHSFVEAHDDEVEAFIHFAHAQPDNVVLLIDTYDTEDGALKVVELAPRLAAEGIAVRGVRLDSGDLAEHAFRVRRILDEGGQSEIRIFASGGLNEHEIKRIADLGAPIDGMGVGSDLTTSRDVACLDCAYKLQEYAGLARRKRSSGKATWPGRKQVYRRYDRQGLMAGDVLTVEGDEQEGEALIRAFMKGGERLAPPEPLDVARARAREELARLPEPLRGLDATPRYPVEVSPALRALAEEVDKRTAGGMRAV